jgi:hypothetical protein
MHIRTFRNESLKKQEIRISDVARRELCSRIEDLNVIRANQPSQSLGLENTQAHIQLLVA